MNDTEKKFKRKRARKLKKQQKKDKPKKIRLRKPLYKSILNWGFQIILVLLFAFVFVYFFCHMRTNVGQSMETTLANDDVVLVNTIAYKMGTPKRNDIVVFKPNGNSKSYSYIKRVIGLPGETIKIENGLIYINGNVYLENKDYPAIQNPGLASETIEIGSNEYFVLGDNRNNSEDSRIADVGNVKLDDIEGKVWFILSPSGKRGFIK